jgi:nucleotide-binding universal stress UspA family protein
MSGMPEALDIRRILVALDASPSSLAALETASRLAVRLQAELVGLFVEDTDLLNLAALPFAREVPALSRSGRALDPARLERELTSQAALARRALARVGEALHLRWSFRTARGRVETELLAAAQDTDLIAVGKTIRPMSSQVRLGRSTRAVAVQTMRSMLFAAPARVAGDAPVAVVYDGSTESRAALALAARLSAREGNRLVVFVPAPEGVEFAQHETAVREQAGSLGIAAAVRRLRGAHLADIVDALRSEPVGLLIVGAQALAAGDSLDLVVEKSTCSVLLVRG